MTARAGTSRLPAEREIADEVRRIFPRLGEDGAHIRALDGGGYGVFVVGDGGRMPVVRIEAGSWHAIERRDLVEPAGEAKWRASAAGLAYWRRLEARRDPFRAQHQLISLKPGGGDEDAPVPVEINEGEAPLGWLRRRKGPDGQPLVSDSQFEAGERLRRDFTLAGLGPQVTTDWSLALTPDGGRRSPRDPSDVPDRVLAARERLARALSDVGPGLSDALLAVICHLQGLERAERNFGWPRRSGKLLLLIALDRLAVHYGLGGWNAARGSGARDQD